MDRFTQRAENGNVFYPHCFEECQGMAETEKCINCEYYDRLLKKFADYEDAEEQGLLLRLPFKIGQKVYYIYESCIDKSLMIGSMIYSYSCLDFPREYFATKEEAEQALKQMGE